MENNMYKNVIRIISCIISCDKLKEHSYVTETKIHKDTFTCLWLEKCTFTSIWESMHQRPVSRKSRKLFAPEKPMVKLQPVCFEKLIF